MSVVRVRAGEPRHSPVKSGLVQNPLEIAGFVLFIVQSSVIMSVKIQSFWGHFNSEMPPQKKISSPKMPQKKGRTQHMTKRIKPLSEVKVRTAKPMEKEYKLFDKETTCRRH